MLRTPLPKKPNTDESSDAVTAFFAALLKAVKAPEWRWESALEIVARDHPLVYKRVTAAKGTDRGTMALALLIKARKVERNDYGNHTYYLRDDLTKVAGRLVAAKGSVSLEQFPRLVPVWIEGALHDVAYARMVSVGEGLYAEHGLAPEVEEGLRTILGSLEEPRRWGDLNADQRRQALRIRGLLDPDGAAGLELTEPWQTPFKGERWKAILAHAGTAKSVAMSDRWAKAARPLLEAVGAGTYVDAFAEAIDAVGRMTVSVDAIHSDMLRGLAWIAGLTDDARAAGLLGRLVLVSAHKLANVGARSQKGFSGAVGALERMGTFGSLAELSNARNRIKSPTLSASLVAALERAARRQSLPLEELEELVVPTYGLELPGVRREILGTVEACLEIVGTTDVELRWLRDGKEIKAPPTEVKEAYAETIKDLKATKKEIEATLAAQRSRVEGMMLSGRTLAYPLWHERYLDHPLLAEMTRRLVWRFSTSPLPSGKEGSEERGQEPWETLGIAPNGVVQDIEGKPLDGLGEGTTVRLWHPIHAGVSAIEAWRETLVAREIRQPFKQAYREIYLLTAAEERTGTYSNRFAAHVLKQHQMNALARGRGWRYALQGFFDSHNTPTLDLPAWRLRAEYFVEVAEMPQVPDAERMTDSGIAFYVVTDQLRFVDRLAGTPVPLIDVPLVVLSETMRDVDLFVGVASVGNDPSWADQGERTGYGTYWREVSFGDLSATAETRRAVLERLLPRLAVGKVARVEGRFLVVRGKRRTYKIHLGSGNILMEPNDQYLCIVPGATKATSNEKVYLPFEGDGVLAIILSKAAMLANDDRITDPTITRQL